MRKISLTIIAWFAFLSSVFSQSGSADSNPILYSSGASSSILPVFTYTEVTHGSQYLFDDWVKGVLISTDGTVYNDPSYGFAYNKVDGALLFTKDRKSAIQVDDSKIKSFTLYDKQDYPENFILMPIIDPAHFVQVIADGNKYKIYKLTITHFVKNNYHNEGMTSTGNNYDEYVDDYTYFVTMNGGAPQKMGLKKKSLREVFKNELDKLNSFFTTNDEPINDIYLRKLGDYLNK
ncbi:hypothetical protein [Mucilaginibacter gotjawali]|uniref:Uncharacterized protein n=1 Tax=Mucilaginibacter gotjawali TaxID=1550579 RepID=A0A839SGR3_9SPHI|nr:hypothetical protein [Mucilaginibacter gotjawali]MBB3056708.1 hypothetical protein [Mucilaginibacter gotjawali]